jgi:hypothetical protein
VWVGLEQCDRCDRWSSLTRLWFVRRTSKSPWETARSFRSCPRCLGPNAAKYVGANVARASTTAGCPIP